MFCNSTIKRFATSLLSIVSLAFVASAQEFRVTEALLKTDGEMMNGPCPPRVVFSGYITANGPGTVKYTFTRSDGIAGPTYAMEFKEAGSKDVSNEWVLENASGTPRFVGWQSISVLTPNQFKSDQAWFKGSCRESPSLNNLLDATDGVSSLGAAATAPSAVPNRQPSVATGGPGAPAAMPRGEFIACPVTEARTEVTTSLPEGWWNTPQIGELHRVNVQTIGGNRTLVCEYRAHGGSVSIMRAFPRGARDCSVEGNGFRCH